MAMLPLSLILLLGSIASQVSALNPRLRVVEGGPTPLILSSESKITPAPSPAELDLRLRFAGVIDRRDGTSSFSLSSCASACINAIVTKSTNCKVNDWSCECSSLNQAIIQAGSLACVYQQCGYLVGANVYSEAADFCMSVINGLYTSDSPTTSFSTVDATDATTSIVIVTKTNSAGSLSVVTSFLTSPTGSSSSGSNGGGSSSSSSSSGLSTGAIAGIAVGAAGGGILLCAIAFLIWRSCMRKGQQKPVSYAPVSHTPDEVAAAGGRAEVDGNSSRVVNVNSPSPGPGWHNATKLAPSVTSTPSPAPAAPVPQVQTTPSPPVPAQITYQNMSQVQTQGAYPPMPELQNEGLVAQQHNAYPHVSELQSQTWQQHQQRQAYELAQSQATGQYPTGTGVVVGPGVFRTSEYQAPGQGVVYQEMEQPRPEMPGSMRLAHEMSGTPRPT